MVPRPISSVADGAAASDAPGTADSGGGGGGGGGDPWSSGTLNAAVSTIYDEVVHYRRNLLLVPYGKSGKEFVLELARIVRGFAEGAGWRPMAWKMVTVACHLLLQKPLGSGNGSDLAKVLRERLVLWRAGRVQELLAEARCVQAHLKPRVGGSVGDDRRMPDTQFAKLVFDGKLHSAARGLSDEAGGGVLRLDDVVDATGDRTVMNVLREKHPAPADLVPECEVAGDPVQPREAIFAGLTADRIKKVSRVVQGSSGPSGVDADGWRRMTTCFDAASDQLCSALAAAGRLICTERTADGEMEGFTAARLIPLDKRPGVRPIAVGEVFRRIISRAIMQIVETDVVGITVPHQLCVGVPSACEVGVHHITSRFAQDDVEGVLLVDASNAFNSVNRSAAIYNIARTCPAMSLIVGNTYREPIRLFVTGGGEVQSREGTCQGDPIAIPGWFLPPAEHDGIGFDCRIVSEHGEKHQSDGGLGLTPPSSVAQQHESSVRVSGALAECILRLDFELGNAIARVRQAKAQARSDTRDSARADALLLRSSVSADMQRTLDLAAEKGASSWLTCRPLRCHRFNLTKGEFRDAVCLRYNWLPPRLPTSCQCGKEFSVSHALSCSVGGFPTFRHNEIRVALSQRCSPLFSQLFVV